MGDQVTDGQRILSGWFLELVPGSHNCDECHKDIDDGAMSASGLKPAKPTEALEQPADERQEQQVEHHFGDVTFESTAGRKQRVKLWPMFLGSQDN